MQQLPEIFPLILFYGWSGILIAAAVGVITARNPVHSVLLLVLCFVISAAIWLLLRAEFLAVALVLVYVGAVMVLLLFVVMMLDINVERMREGLTRYAPLGVVVGLGVRVGVLLGPPPCEPLPGWAAPPSSNPCTRVDSAATCVARLSTCTTSIPSRMKAKATAATTAMMKRRRETKLRNRFMGDVVNGVLGRD